MGFPCGFDPWVGKIPWRRERLPTPVFWPGEFHEVYSPWSRKEYERIYIYVSLSHFSVQRKLTQHAKSTILQ